MCSAAWHPRAAQRELRGEKDGQHVASLGKRKLHLDFLLLYFFQRNKTTTAEKGNTSNTTFLTTPGWKKHKEKTGRQLPRDSKKPVQSTRQKYAIISMTAKLLLLFNGQKPCSQQLIYELLISSRLKRDGQFIICVKQDHKDDKNSSGSSRSSS